MRFAAAAWCVAHWRFAAAAEVCDSGGAAHDGNVWRRAECLGSPAWNSYAPGSPALSEGRWVADAAWYKGTRWAVAPGAAACALAPLSGGFVAAVAEAYGGGAIVFVGDSIVGGQLKNLDEATKSPRGPAQRIWQSLRSDELKTEGKDSGWIAAVCAAPAALINTGAHYHGVGRFKQRLNAAFGALRAACPERLDAGRVFFRTTPEGNPLCNSKAHLSVRDMDDWHARIGAVINGSLAPPPEVLFSRGWHWDKFDSFNVVAARLAALYNITVVDVVPMTRLRPWDDWVHTRRVNVKGPSRDCLHGNPASAEWNTLFFNAMAASVCRPDVETKRIRNGQILAKQLDPPKQLHPPTPTNTTRRRAATQGLS